MATNNSNRREQARETYLKMREQQARREKRNRALLIGGIVVALALVAGAVWLIVSQGSRSAIEQLSGDEIPANTRVEDGGISLGSAMAAGTANEGAPEVNVYLDYTCHYCLQFEDQYTDYLDEATRAGDITAVYHPVGILDATGEFSGYSGRAAAAAATVAAQQPDAFPAAHGALLEMGQAYVDSQGQTDPDAAAMASALEGAGVSAEVAQEAANSSYAPWVEATTTQFGRDGHTGTPTIVVDGEILEQWSTPNALQDAVAAAGQ